jgi:hypothetical protein
MSIFVQPCAGTPVVVSIPTSSFGPTSVVLVPTAVVDDVDVVGSLAIVALPEPESVLVEPDCAPLDSLPLDVGSTDG